MTDLHDKARAVVAKVMSAREATNHWLAGGAEDCDLDDAVLDLIAATADLLAENERLTHALAAQVAATNGASAYAVEQTHRAEAAEARLRQLASAEPVAWAYKMEGDLQWQYTPNQQIAIGLVVPLIRRPSMEVPRG